MLLFIPRSLCALKRVAAKAEHSRYGATQGIRFSQVSGLYRAEATDGRRAILVQGLTPAEDPPWPGFKEPPDDACEAIILPKDLERACKVGDDSLQSRFGMVGIATNGEGVSLGLGADVITTRVVDGRFPNVEQVIPKKTPCVLLPRRSEAAGRHLARHRGFAAGILTRSTGLLLRRRSALGFCAKNSD